MQRRRQTKRYVREGGIAQFWDEWRKGYTIDYHTLGQL